MPEQRLLRGRIALWLHYVLQEILREKNWRPVFRKPLGCSLKTRASAIFLHAVYGYSIQSRRNASCGKHNSLNCPFVDNAVCCFDLDCVHFCFALPGMDMFHCYDDVRCDFICFPPLFDPFNSSSPSIPRLVLDFLRSDLIIAWIPYSFL